MTNPTHWAAAARPGDIAMFRYPLSESDEIAKARPCLILAARIGDTGLRLTLAYGTTTPPRATRSPELSITEPSEAAMAGLTRPTRFVLSRRITVRGDDPRFDRDRQGTALIGRLPSVQQTAMQRVIRQLGPRVSGGNGSEPRPSPPLRARRTISRRNRSGRVVETVVVETRRKRI